MFCGLSIQCWVCAKCAIIWIIFTIRYSKSTIFQAHILKFIHVLFRFFFFICSLRFVSLQSCCHFFLHPIWTACNCHANELYFECKCYGEIVRFQCQCDLTVSAKGVKLHIKMYSDDKSFSNIRSLAKCSSTSTSSREEEKKKIMNSSRVKHLTTNYTKLCEYQVHARTLFFFFWVTTNLLRFFLCLPLKCCTFCTQRFHWKCVHQPTH